MLGKASSGDPLDCSYLVIHFLWDYLGEEGDGKGLFAWSLEDTTTAIFTFLAP